MNRHIITLLAHRGMRALHRGVQYFDRNPPAPPAIRRSSTTEPPGLGWLALAVGTVSESVRAQGEEGAKWAAARTRFTPSALLLGVALVLTIHGAADGYGRYVAGLALFAGLIALTVLVDAIATGRSWDVVIARPYRGRLWLTQIAATIFLGASGRMHGATTIWVALVLLAGQFWSRLEIRLTEVPDPRVEYLVGADRARWDMRSVRALARNWRAVSMKKGLGEWEAASDGSRRWKSDSLLKVVVDERGPQILVRIGVGRTLEEYRRHSDAFAVAFNVFRCDVLASSPNRLVLRLVVTDSLSGRSVSVDPRTLRYPLPVTARWNFGITEDGSQIGIDITNSVHTLITGSSGSGKSTVAVGLIAHMIRMHENARVLVVDPHSAVVAPFRDLVSWSYEESEPGPVEEMLNWVMDECYRRRPLFENLRISGFGAEHFNSDLPMIVVVVDEVSTYLTGMRSKALVDQLRRVAAEGRKYGVHLFLLVQKPDGVTLLTAIRDQLVERIALATESVGGATVALPSLTNKKMLIGLPPGHGFAKVGQGFPLRFRADDYSDPWAIADSLRSAGLRSPALNFGHEGRRARSTSFEQDELLDALLSGSVPGERSTRSHGNALEPGSETLGDLLASREITRGTYDRLGDISLDEACKFTEADLLAIKGHHHSAVDRLKRALARRGLQLTGERRHDAAE